MQAKQIFGANFATTKAGMTGISGAATTFTTANAVIFAIGGKAYSKAAVSGGTTPTTDGVTGAAFTALVANQGCTFVWCLNAAGDINVVQGGVDELDVDGNFKTGRPQFPILPATLTPFAYQVTKAGSTTAAAWTFGSSNWNTTGLTHTVQDVLVMPDRPQ
jgi:hypothetical protein